MGLGGGEEVGVSEKERQETRPTENDGAEEIIQSFLLEPGDPVTQLIYIFFPYL